MEDEKENDDIITIDVSSLTGGGGGAGSYLSSCDAGLTWNSMAYSYPTSTYSIANGGTGAVGASNFTYSTITTPAYNASNGLTVTGDADFKGDVKIDGRSVRDSLAEIEKRLSILVPDPKKLAKYEALRKAYEHYKVMEAMCYGDDDE